MRRFVSLITILCVTASLVLCSTLVHIGSLVGSPMCYAANHGADAHSPSMSSESGKKPISDKSTTEDPGAITEEEEMQEAEEEEAEEEEAEEAEEVLSDGDEAAQEDMARDLRMLWIKRILMVACPIMALIAAILLLRSFKKDKKRKPEGKRFKK